MNNQENWFSNFEGRRAFNKIYASRQWGAVAGTIDPAKSHADELAQLRSLGLKHVAAVIETSFSPEKARRPDGYLFEVGPVQMSAKGATILGLTSEEVLGFVGLHARGDGGHYGIWSELEPTEDELRSNHRHSIAIQNKATVLSGRGIVRGRFTAFRPNIDAPPKPGEFDTRRRRNENEYVEVMTLLGPGGPGTLVWTSLD